MYCYIVFLVSLVSVFSGVVQCSQLPKSKFDSPFKESVELVPSLEQSKWNYAATRFLIHNFITQMAQMRKQDIPDHETVQGLIQTFSKIGSLCTRTRLNKQAYVLVMGVKDLLKKENMFAKKYGAADQVEKGAICESMRAMRKETQGAWSNVSGGLIDIGARAQACFDKLKRSHKNATSWHELEGYSGVGSKRSGSCLEDSGNSLRRKVSFAPEPKVDKSE